MGRNFDDNPPQTFLPPKSFKKTKAHIGKVCPTILVLALLTYLYVPLNSMMADLALKVPQINWMLYFQELVHPMIMTENEEIVSYSTRFFVRLGKLLAETDKKVVHNYIIWRLVMDLMPHMPPQYEGTRAEFRRVLLGVLQDR